MEANQITDNYGKLHNVSDHFSDVQSVSRAILFEQHISLSGGCLQALESRLVRVDQ